MNKILVIGPWVGEFASEIFTWQGYMRLKVKTEKYKKVIVYGPEHRKYLYQDFCDEYIDFPFDNSKSCMSSIADGGTEVLEKSEQFQEIVRKYSDTNLYEFITSWKWCGSEHWNKSLAPYVEGDQMFIPLGEHDKSLEYDIVFHMRNRTTWGTDRNWKLSNWEKLIDSLKGKYKMVCVGAGDDLCIEGVEDFRNCSLEKEANLLRSSKLLVGALSGGVQFGMLCGIHIITWGLSVHHKGFNEHFNPLKNPNTFISIFNNIPLNPEYLCTIIEKKYNQIK